MNKFTVRFINLIAVISILFTYNSLLENRQLKTQLNHSQNSNNILLETQSSMLTSLESNLESVIVDNGVETIAIADEVVPAGISETVYKDGSYSGSAAGFGGTVSVEVIISNGQIYSVIVTSASGEDEAYLTMAEEIIPNIISTQSPEIDTISGATFSSTGIKNAVIEALKDAK